MQTWAKRGLQTALVTGGLFMLGTGIASASENVNPDRSPSPLDGAVSVPVDIHSNAVGTPFGQVDLPGFKHTYTTPNLGQAASGASKALPAPLAKPTQQATDTVGKAVGKPVAKAKNALSGLAAKTPVAGDLGKVAKTVGKHASPMSTQQAGTGDPFRGNKLVGDLAVPVDISGNAIALGGPVSVTNDDSQHFAKGGSATTSGSGPLSGNVVGLQGAVPVQVTGNAIALLGDAKTRSKSHQTTAAGGDVTTSGDGGALAGNVLVGQLATPVQVTGNSIAGGGVAKSKSQATSAAHTDGSLDSYGDNSALSGNVAGLPAAVPVGLSGNALSGLGAAGSKAKTAANAVAGSTDRAPRSGLGPNPYIETSGNHALLSGTAAAPTLSGPVAGNGNAGSLLGYSKADGATDNTTKAGGFISTMGKHALGSGTIVNPTGGVPVDLISNAVGNGEASSDNTVNSVAGGGSYTNGEGSGLSATNLTAKAGYPVEGFANAVGVAGAAVADSDNDVNVKSGGYDGTIGNDSALSANEVTVPLAGAVEAFGNAGGAVGAGLSNASETKTVDTDGGTNTNDDNGKLSSNLVQVAGALPLQAFGGSINGLGTSSSHVTNDSKFTGGGHTEANGKHGVASGNIAQVPVSLPGQLFGEAASVVGAGDGMAQSTTTAQAGGDATATGANGKLAGNVVSVPVGSAGQLFGDAVTLVGADNGTAAGQTTSTAGGTVTTVGDGGVLAGDVVTAQLLPVLQGFGDAIGVGGADNAIGAGETVVSSGGDVTTSGKHAALSGDILDVPAAVVGQAFGDGVGVLGSENAVGNNALVGTAGGTDTSAGQANRGSGIVGQAPIGVVGQLYNVAIPVLAHVTTAATNATDVTVGNKAPQLDFPFDGGNMAGLPVNALPTMPNLAALPKLPGAPAAPSLQSAPAGVAGGVLPSAVPTSAVPGLGQLDSLRAPFEGILHGVLAATSGAHTLPAVPAVPAANLPVPGRVNAPMSTQSANRDLAVPGLSSFHLNLPSVGGASVPDAVPGLSNLDSSKLRQAFADLQQKASGLSARTPSLPQAGSLFSSFNGMLPNM